MNYIQLKGLLTPGIFRRSPSSSALSCAKNLYNLGMKVDLDGLGGIHVAAVLLKMFFHDLSDPIVPSVLYPFLKDLNSKEF